MSDHKAVTQKGCKYVFYSEIQISFNKYYPSKIRCSTSDVVGIVVDVNICVVDCNDVTPFVVVDVDNVVIGVVSTVFVTMDEVLQRIFEG
jgi:hypothetical protein